MLICVIIQLVNLKRFFKIGHGLVLAIILFLFCYSFNPVSVSAKSDPLSISSRYSLYRLMLNANYVQSSSYYPIRLSSLCLASPQTIYKWSGSDQVELCPQNASHGLSLSDVSWFSSYNTSNPSGINDGALWQGAGYNNAVSFGAAFRWRYFSLKLNPIMGLSQNLRYDLHPYSNPDNQPYTYWLQRVDYVQRMGDDPFFLIDPGESELEFAFRGFHTGFSSTQMLSGPGIHTSLIYGLNAPGIRRFFIGTKHPQQLFFGRLGVHYFYGVQRKSDYFDNRPSNRLTSIHNLQIFYSPDFAPGLSFGLNRTYQEYYPDSFSAMLTDMRKMFDPFSKEKLTGTTDSTSDADNQMAAVFFRWAFPEQRFELYGEWGRNDHAVNWEEFFIQPDHYRAYLFGGMKSFAMGSNRILGVGFELNQLNSTRNSFVRLTSSSPFGGAQGPWGTHWEQTIGLSNRGQLLGNGYGVGANVRSLRLDYLNKDSFTRFTFNKIAHNPALVDDPRYRSTVRLYNGYTATHATRMTELLVTMHHTRTILAGTELGVGLDLSYTLNRYHISNNNAFNARFEFSLRREIQPWW